MGWGAREWLRVAGTTSSSRGETRGGCWCKGGSAHTRHAARTEKAGKHITARRACVCAHAGRRSAGAPKHEQTSAVFDRLDFGLGAARGRARATRAAGGPGAEHTGCACGAGWVGGRAWEAVVPGMRENRLAHGSVCFWGTNWNRPTPRRVRTASASCCVVCARKKRGPTVLTLF